MLLFFSYELLYFGERSPIEVQRPGLLIVPVGERNFDERTSVFWERPIFASGPVPRSAPIKWPRTVWRPCPVPRWSRAVPLSRPVPWSRSVKRDVSPRSVPPGKHRLQDECICRERIGEIQPEGTTIVLKGQFDAGVTKDHLGDGRVVHHTSPCCFDSAVPCSQEFIGGAVGRLIRGLIRRTSAEAHQRKHERRTHCQ